ncbi:MAG TPA: hypothetical protein HA359_03865, partial [Candidatus Poseidoniaceae archaeon]|nr:hypothetical protein [Candidatus Poseidoniaceae archaeon]
MQFNRNLGSNVAKSIFIAILMISMSLSMGFMGDNNPPWSTESTVNSLDDSSQLMQTSGSPPSILYSATTLGLEKDVSMTPLTPVNSGGALESQTLSSIVGGVEHFHSIALDSNGDSHISMYDSASGGIKYISDSSGSWVDISLVSANNVGMHNSIAIDSNDAIHIAYFGYLNPEGTGVKNLMYSSCVSLCGTQSSWSTIIIDNSGDVGKWNSIAIDSNNKIHISYYDSSTANKDLKYATCTSSCATASSWSSITVDSNGDLGEHTSIAIDSNDVLHIVYSSATTLGTGSGNSNQKYATCTSSCATPSSWTITSLNAPEDSIQWNSLTVDSNDALHMVFYDQDLRDIFYSMCASLCTSASSWSTSTIQSNNDVGAPNSIGVDSNNGIHVSYFTNNPNYDLEYAKCLSSCSSQSSWSTTTLFSSGFVGWQNSIAVNQNDNSVHITFTDYTASTFNYISTDSFGYSVSPDLPSGLNLDMLDGTISGTPTVSSPATPYTITASNSHGSDTVSMTIAVATLPSISYAITTVDLVQNFEMTPLNPIIAQGTDAPTGCVVSSGNLPPGLSIDNSCVISGTPTSVTSEVFTVTPSTAAGNGAPITITLNVNPAGGTLTITPTTTQATVGNPISDITMTYTHTATVYPWESGVENINAIIDLDGGIYSSADLAMDIGEHGEIAIAYAKNSTGPADDGTRSLGLLYKWGDTWTDIILDNSTDTGLSPSLEIDRNGAIHIAYIDRENGELYYQTNASSGSSWQNMTLGLADVTSGVSNTDLLIHPTTNAVHIVATGNDNTNYLKHYSNESGSWVNTTISNLDYNEGNYPVMEMDCGGNLFVIYFNSSSGDLMMSSRVDNNWQNETVKGYISANWKVGKHSDMAIDSTGTIHIIAWIDKVTDGVVMVHGTPGNWVDYTNGIWAPAYYPVIEVDSNDVVHAAYHVGQQPKYLRYLNNEGGSLPATTSHTTLHTTAGGGIDMEIDNNDDLFISHYTSNTQPRNLYLSTYQGTGQALTVHPTFEISPSLPDGLTMNWCDGTISGTPTLPYANTQHTVTVTAMGVTTTGTFTLEVIEAPDISYPGAPYTFTKNSPVNGATPTNIGGVADSWTIISGTLPSGVTLDSSTGELVGTPTAVSTTNTIVIQATNSAGSSWATISIEVQDEAPSSID